MSLTSITRLLDDDEPRPYQRVVRAIYGHASRLVCPMISCIVVFLHFPRSFRLCAEWFLRIIHHRDGLGLPAGNPRPARLSWIGTRRKWQHIEQSEEKQYAEQHVSFLILLSEEHSKADSIILDCRSRRSGSRISFRLASFKHEDLCARRPRHEQHIEHDECCLQQMNCK